jgi:hypothetical protein
MGFDLWEVLGVSRQTGLVVVVAGVGLAILLAVFQFSRRDHSKEPTFKL